jgi:hypothetical protein
MSVAPFNKFYSFVEAVAEKVHNLGADSLKIMLVNSPAPVATNTKKSDLTEITAGNGYTAGGTAPSITSSVQTLGSYKLILGDVTISATGAVGPFRYVVLYNDTATNKELIGWWDNGASVTLANGETFTTDFDGSAGVLQLV